jgi:hypothetical protein
MAGSQTSGGAIMSGVLGIVTGIFASKISEGVAHRLLGDPDKEDDEKYDKIHKIISKREFYIPRTDEQPDVVPRQISAGGQKESPMVYVEEAIQDLETAKTKTHCGVCLKGIDAAIKAVKDKSEVVKRADSKYTLMQDLKAAGKIPQDATWNTLTLKQRQFINRKVEQVIQNG